MNNNGFLIILIIMTIINFLYDRLSGIINSNTISWQFGMMTAITVIWFIERGYLD